MSRRRFRRPGRRRRRLGAALLLAAATMAGSARAAAPPPVGPPQFLPITARWCLQASPGGPPPPCLQLEVPRTDLQHAWGLQLRPPLPPLRGMWFPYVPPARARFWMHRTPEPLDMIFVAEGRVVAIEAGTRPCPRLPCPSYGPDDPVEGVLELAAGQAAALGIVVGTPVRIESLPALSPGGAPAAPARD
ncbi:MAG: DUF192 domain-containing protein [Prochlorococcaceae cyanobacterium]